VTGVRPKLARRRVLIVDDEPATGRSIKALLEADHDVDVVTSGDMAEGLLLGDARYDVVLCDVAMPGMSGVALYERIATARPGMERRFVFMTGGGVGPPAARFLDATSNLRLDKPFTASDLERAIAKTF
jgi:CheY-like chemotaxis protein